MPVGEAISGPPQPELPQVFGRYLLLRRLSRGGMGEIFLAKLGEIEGFEKLVIIKKILPHLAADTEFIKRFIDEAQVAIKLSHANIAPVFEVGRVDGEYFLAIEYVEGRDLRRLTARQREEQTRLPPDLCLYIARELASGLAYAHRRTDAVGHSLALVHCDISPPNIMISFEGEVKIIDFGIAKSALRVAETNPNMGFGKLGYMAPEQLLKGGTVDRRTDIYAAGVLLYELLTGERLFTPPDGNDYRQIARTVTQGKFPVPSARDPRLDPELDALVMRAIAPKPQGRYQTAEELRDAIQVKLSQMNPTLTGDGLAHFMRGLFQDEMDEERQLVDSMKAVDLAPFQGELTATAEHTVTFARAGMVQRLVARVGSGASAALVPTAEQIFTHPRRRMFFMVGATASMVAGGAVALLLLRARVPVVAPPAPPAVMMQPRPVVTHLSPPTHLPLPTPALAGPLRRAERHHVRIDTPAHVILPSRVTPEEVQLKFRQVRVEYAAFKRQYGPVLENRWNEIATEITFGKADKYQRVDALLDSLRREMARVKQGG